MITHDEAEKLQERCKGKAIITKGYYGRSYSFEEIVEIAKIIAGE